MNRTVAYLLGPELVWLLTFGLATFLASRNQPVTEAGNEQLLTLGWILPSVAVVLSFATLSWAPGSPWIWLLRIGVVGFLAVIGVVNTLCEAIDYQDSRNSGVGSALIVYIILGYLLLFGGILMAIVFFLTKWNFLPFLKWSLIILGGLASLLGLIFWIASFGKSNPS